MAKTDNAKGGASKHAHTVLIDGFRDFNTRAEDHFSFSQVADPGKFSNIPPIWLLLNSESTINIIMNKAMVSNINNVENPITPHYNAGSHQVEYTTNINGYSRVW